MLTVQMKRLVNSITEYSGRLPAAFFLTILNPFHSIWEPPAVCLSLSLSPHTHKTAATPLQREKKSPSLSLCVSVVALALLKSFAFNFSLSISLCSCLSLSLSGEQTGLCWWRREQASPSSTEAERRMGCLEWESDGLQHPSLLPSSSPPPLLAPSLAESPAQSPARLEGQNPPTRPLLPLLRNLRLAP